MATTRSLLARCGTMLVLTVVVMSVAAAAVEEETFLHMDEGLLQHGMPPNPPMEDPMRVVDPSLYQPLDQLPPPEASEHYETLQQALRDAQKRDIVCDTPFGTRLGEAHGVVAYSNCNNAYVSQEVMEHTVTLKGDSGVAKVTYNTGLKYQCVEYARRYLFQHFGVVFSDVMGAVDIWRLTSVHVPHDEKTRYHLGRYRNHDDADRMPSVGSLVIWPIQEDMPFGHVAVIVGVKVLEVPQDRKDHNDPQQGPYRAAVLQIAEQNYDSHEWKHQTYSREIYLDTRDGEYFAIHDPHYRTFGWMTVEKDIKPLDQFLHDEEEPGLPTGHTLRVDPADVSEDQ